MSIIRTCLCIVLILVTMQLLCSCYSTRNIDLYNEGKALEDHRMIDAAIAKYTESIEADAKWGLPYCARGELYRENGELNKALEDYNKAVDVDPSSHIYFHRGMHFYHIGEDDKALTDFNTALEKDSTNYTVFGIRGMLHAKYGNHPAAIADYEDYLEYKYSDAVQFRLVSSYFDTQQFEECLSAMKRIEKNSRFAKQCQSLKEQME